MASKMVLVPYEEYENLLKRAVQAPKRNLDLSDKQKAKVRNAMLDACVVMMHRREMAQHPVPEVQALAERTMN